MTHPTKPAAARELAEAFRAWDKDPTDNGYVRMLQALSRYDAARGVCDTVTQAGRRLVACITGDAPPVGGTLRLTGGFVDRLLEFRAAMEGAKPHDDA